MKSGPFPARGATWRYLAAIPLLVVGCGSGIDADRPERFPVSGVVLHNAEPLAGATVVFVPDDHQYGATASTDDSGRFELQTFEPKDGAVPGSFKVTVRKFEMEPREPGQTPNELSDDGSTEDDGGDAGRSPAAGGDVTDVEPVIERSLIPEKYGSPATSGLQVDVSETGPNEFTFELE